MKNVEDIYPLSPVQQGMLFHCLANPEAGIYVNQLSCTLEGELDAGAFRQAWQELLDRHLTFRTAFLWEGLKEPRQVVRRTVALPWREEDWRGLPETDQDRRLEAVLHTERHLGFDMARAPLMRLVLIRRAGNVHDLVWTHHHLLMDGWSLARVWRELFSLYEALRRGGELPAREDPGYGTYIAWLMAQDPSRADAFWRSTLQDFAVPTPLEMQPAAVSGGRPGEQEEQQLTLPGATAELATLAQRHRLTLNTLVLGAWALVLSRYSGEDDVVFGVTVAGRPADLPGVESIVGLFINTLPLRVQVDPEAPVLPWLAELQARQIDLRQYEHSPLVQVQKHSGVPGGVPLFGSIFVFESSPVDTSGQERQEGLRVLRARARQSSNYPLNVLAFPGERLALKVLYDVSAFDSLGIRRLVGHLATVLQDLAARPGGRLRDLRMLPAAERLQVTAEWNDTGAPYDRETCIHHLFAAQARQRPGKVAVVSEQTTLTYREVDEASGRLACLLRDLGIGRGELVAVLLQRSAEMVPALLGILRAGAAYVPLEVHHPQSRLRWILSSLRVRAVVTETPLLDLAGALGRTLPELELVICVDPAPAADEGALAARLSPHQRLWTRSHLDRVPAASRLAEPLPDDLAYVIFTSGSTGAPKGVVVRHRPVVNLIEWVNRTFGVGPLDRGLFITALSFDLSVYDVFGLLAAGGSIRVASEREVGDAELLTRLLCAEPVTYWDSAPAALQQLLPFLPSASESAASRLRLVFLSGDWIPVSMPDRIRASFPRAQVVSLGGATEATVWSNFHPLGEVDARWASIPYGRPIQNARYLILDPDLEPCPIGVAGDLYIGGECLASGYTDLGITADRFLPDPFGDRPVARLYRTGDRARFGADGTMEFLGRRDQQVKIRGFRIELGEIEVALGEHPAVRDVVVTAWQDARNEKRLVAYVVPSGAAPSISALRRHLEERLPAYMVPSAILFLAALPVTSNGKLDRGKLPPPGEVLPDAEQLYTAPGSVAEEILATFWAEVLGRERVGVHDNFFELGGDSIRSIQILAKARKAGLALSPGDFFDHPTVAEQAALAEAARRTEDEPEATVVALPLVRVQEWLGEREPTGTPPRNPSMLLELTEQLGPTLLERAVRELSLHHAALRRRFLREEAGWRPVQAGPGDAATLAWIDLSGLPEEHRRPALEAALAAVQESLGPTAGPIARFVLFQGDLASGGSLQIAVHQLAGDAVSWRILLEDLEAACRQLQAGAEVELPAQSASYEPFPLTDLQQAYWIGGTDAFDLALSAHVVQEVELEDLDLERLERALERLIDRHAMLRAFVSPDGRQQVLRHVPPYRIEVLDLRGWSPGEAEAAVRQVRERMELAGPPTGRWPLFELRLSRLDGRDRLHLGISLLIVDGLTLPRFLTELLRLYRDPGAFAKPLELSFRDYVLAMAARQESEAYRRAEEYWHRRLASLPGPPELPLVRAPGSLRGHRLEHRSGTLEPELWQRFQAQAARIGVTPTVALCTVYAEVLALWSKSPRFTLNVLFSNRPPFHAEVDQIFGNCSTTLLLEVDSAPRESFRVRAVRLQQQLWRDLEHSRFSGVRVLRELNRRQGRSSRAAMPVVFTSALNLRRPATPAAAAGTVWKARMTYSAVQTPQVWLDHQVGESAGRLGFNWDAVDELLPEGLVAAMVEAYRSLLLQLAEDEASWEEAVHGLLPPEQLRLCASVNATAAPVSPRLLHTLFEDQVPQRRNQPAVVAAGRTLSYGQLLRLSRALAHRLRALGARPNRLVAVVMAKGWEQVVATLAVMQSGAAYLPIDPGLPLERFHYLLEHGEVELALTQPALLDRLEWPAGVAVVAIGDEEPAAEPPVLEPVQRPEDLAYVLFTSGSTGLPKGVMIDHRGAVNTVLDVNQRFNVGPEDRVLALSRLSFDLSVYDFFGLLAAGGTIVLPDSADAREPARWAERIARERVTVWSSVPALMEMLVHDLESRSEALPPSLSRVLLSGDWIPVSLPDRIRALGKEVRVISLGGATEASIWSIYHPVDRVDPAWASIPYGRPLSNQTVHVLDEALEPRPAWVPGQLYIGGIGVAKGYWRDEEKTRSGFLVHPRSGERLYRTGDLGRSLPDGTIEFLGREDSQVKIHGYRIELGEIEAALAGHPVVRACVVAALGEPRGERRLVAYVVLDAELDGGAPATAAMTSLRAFLAAKLPDYMLPASFVRLDALPLTSNGKVDRSALSDVARTAERQDALVAPRDEIERELVRIWEEVLAVQPVGVRDSFFDLGGHSLLAVRLMGRIRQQFERDLTLSVLFSEGTVEHLASILRERREPAPRPLLVPIQTAGSKPPFFCVHPVGGSVLCYAALARRLGPDQPFYGLQAPDPDERQGLSLEEMAELYVRELPPVEPQGQPYRLGGWSMGGLVAFEMARQLRAQGRAVALLALIDAVPPGCGAYPEAADEASLGAWFARDVEALAGAGAELDPMKLQRIFEGFRANARALLAHTPGLYAGRVVLFRAGEDLAGGRDAELAWSSLAADLETHVLPGDHYSLVREPHVQALAELLKSALEGAQELLPAEAPASRGRRGHDAELPIPSQ